MALLAMAWFHAPGAMMAATATEPSPRHILERAKALEEEQQYGEAVAAYRQYLLARPDNDDVRATVARLLSWQGEWDEAAGLYRDLLSRHPLDHDIRGGLALVLSWQKKFDQAREEYERILQDEPSHVEALSGLGDVLLWSGHQEQAIPYYERVVAATGDAQVAARLQSLKAASASAAAVVPPSEPLANRQADPMAFDGTQALERGGRLETMRQYADAIAVYREGLQQTPGHDEIRTALARVLSWQGAHEEATALYREVLERHPQDQEIRVALAQVLSWQQQFDEARSLYQAALQAEPAQVDARRGLA